MTDHEQTDDELATAADQEAQREELETEDRVLPLYPEPPVGTWARDRFGALTMRQGSGWGQPGIMPFGRWDAMNEARGPYVEVGPWGRPLEEKPAPRTAEEIADEVSSRRSIGTYSGLTENTRRVARAAALAALREAGIQ